MIKDSQPEYFTDERSGSEQDSDKEFDAIVALDHLLKQVQEHTVGESREY